MKSIVTHLGLLLLASVLAFSIWTRDESAEQEKANTVEVWSGSPDGVELITYETKQRKLRIEPRKDALGRWYVVNFDKEETPPPHPNGDAGAEQAAPAPKHQISSFIGVKAAEESVKRLAALRALRSLGKVDAAKLADYGLDKPEGTLKVKNAGREQVLTIGGQTPGGSERYAKYGSSGEIFAVESDLLQSLQFADSRLMERELHAFPIEDAQRITISKGSKLKNVVRVADKKDAWADAATPNKADETVVNWLTKLERLRTLEYVEKPTTPPGPDPMVVRVEFFAGPKSLGFLELYKVPGEKSAEYLVRTEYTRWYVKIVSGSGEQLDQDLSAILK